MRNKLIRIALLVIICITAVVYLFYYVLVESKFQEDIKTQEFIHGAIKENEVRDKLIELMEKRLEQS